MGSNEKIIDLLKHIPKQVDEIGYQDIAGLLTDEVGREKCNDILRDIISMDKELFSGLMNYQHQRYKNFDSEFMVSCILCGIYISIKNKY